MADSDLSELSSDEQPQTQPEISDSAGRTLRSRRVKLEEEAPADGSVAQSPSRPAEPAQEEQQPVDDENEQKMQATAQEAAPAAVPTDETEEEKPALEQPVVVQPDQPQEASKPEEEKPLKPTMFRTAPLPAFVPASLLTAEQRRRSSSGRAASKAASTATLPAPPVPSSSAMEATSSSTSLGASTSAAGGDASTSSTTKPKRSRVRTVGDDDEQCPVCSAIPASQRKSTTRSQDNWIQCDGCSRWFHWESCVRKSAPPKTTHTSFEEWYCLECLTEAAAIPSLTREIKLVDTSRKSSRKKADVQYGSSSSSSKKPGANPWHTVAESKPLISTRFRQMTAAELTTSWLENDPRAFLEPIFVAAPEGLDMRVLPADIKISEIASLVGPDTPIDVIDVMSQSGLSNWTLGRWAEYYESANRERIRNVISLELSSSAIKDRIASPRLVREIDWVEQYWPVAEMESGEYPKVSRYCLMSPGLSWTDWHIDFSASSVFYHILRGSKVFYFIAPTPANLRAYERWSGNGDMQASTWLGDMCDKVYRVQLEKGNTMIIPSGWIHCVYTPSDALVIGGNFLHDYNIALQLRVYQIELNTKVPKRFRFPYFVRMLWYVGKHWHDVLARSTSADTSGMSSRPRSTTPASNGRSTTPCPVPARILQGLKPLSSFLIEQSHRLTAPQSGPGSVSAERRRLANESVPWEQIADPATFARTLQDLAYAALGEKAPLDIDDFPKFDAGSQEWLGPEWTYSLSPEIAARSSVLNAGGQPVGDASLKRKSSALQGPPNGNGPEAAAKTAKFKHFANGNGPIAGLFHTNGSPSAQGAHQQQRRAPVRNATKPVNGYSASGASPSVNGSSVAKQTGAVPNILAEEQHSIKPYTEYTREARQRPQLAVSHDVVRSQDASNDLAAGLPAGPQEHAQMQDAEVRTTLSQHVVKKTMRGPEDGSLVVETRRVVTTIERVYFGPLPTSNATTANADEMDIDAAVERRPMEVLALQAASEQESIEHVASA